MKIDKGDTQSLPGLAEELEEIQAPYPQQPERRAGGVRELKQQLPAPPVPSKQEQGTWLTPGCRKGLMLAVGFAAALLLGFGLAGIFQDQSAAQQAERQQQEQQFKNREEKLASQEADLRAERERLARQKQELEQRQQELTKESGLLQGQNERLQEESKSQGLGRMLDKVTGKEKQRQETVNENKARSEKVESDISQVRGSIQEAQQMLDEVDSQLSKVESMQQEVESLRRQAEKAYRDNESSINEMAGFISKGAEFLRSLLAR